MPVTHDTLRLVDGLRVSIGKHVDDATRSLVGSWARAWDVLAVQWRQAVDDVVAQSESGWPDATTIARMDRAERAFAATRTEVLNLSRLAGVTIVQVLPAVADIATEWHRQVIDSELPPAELRGSIGIEFNRVDRRAISAMVERVTGDMASYLQPLSAAAEEQMRRSLIAGVALGDNPRTVAANMVRNLEGDFAGGLSRALNIARTEMLDVSRQATKLADDANPGLVTGWYWWADLDERTCASCWSMHGSFHPADEPGPDDHQSGRCARVPATPSWSDLGFGDIPEPEPIIADAEATFWTLPESKQVQIMGQARLDGLRDGSIKWSDLSVKRSSEGWRDSFAVRPLREMPRAS